jgi:5-methylcytosine-specific restriction endonuclease McrA
MRRQALMSKGGKQLGRAEWRFLVSLAQGVCLCCGEGGKLVADHIIPVAAGGRNEIGNRQPLCGQCNARKGVGRTDYRSDYFRARVDQYIRTS